MWVLLNYLCIFVTKFVAIIVENIVHFLFEVYNLKLVLKVLKVLTTNNTLVLKYNANNTHQTLDINTNNTFNTKKKCVGVIQKHCPFLPVQVL